MLRVIALTPSGEYVARLLDNCEVVPDPEQISDRETDFRAMLGAEYDILTYFMRDRARLYSSLRLVTELPTTERDLELAAAAELAANVAITTGDGLLGGVGEIAIAARYLIQLGLISVEEVGPGGN